MLEIGAVAAELEKILHVYYATSLVLSPVHQRISLMAKVLSLSSLFPHIVV